MAITILAIAAKTSAMIATLAHLISTASALPADASALESAISALVKDITALDSRSEFWEKALPWFTGLVVVGLIADVVVVVWERRDQRRARLRWVRQGFHPAEVSPAWRFALELLATSAILLGVALELWAGAAIANINGQLRSKNAELRNKSNQLVVLVTQQAGTAAASAQKAQDAAQRAWEYAAWRTISDEQSKLIRTCVGSLLNGHTLTIQANPDEAEIWTFASEIASSFGMKATATLWPRGWIVSAGLKFSIGKNRQKDFDLMIKALDVAGVDKAMLLKKQSDHKNVSDDDLILTVGPRH